MIQFVSNNLNDLNIQYFAMEGLVVPKAGFVADYSFLASVPNTGTVGFDADNRAAEHWADVKVKFKRDLRTSPFAGGDLWIEPHRAGRPGVILMATRRSLKQVSLPLFRLALRKLARWADRNKIASVALCEIGKGVAISDTQIRDLLYQQLGASTCQFWAEESGFQRSAFSTNGSMCTTESRRSHLSRAEKKRVNSNRLEELSVQPAGLMASRFANKLRETTVVSSD